MKIAIVSFLNFFFELCWCWGVKKLKKFQRSIYASNFTNKWGVETSLKNNTNVQLELIHQHFFTVNEYEINASRIEMKKKLRVFVHVLRVQKNKRSFAKYKKKNFKSVRKLMLLMNSVSICWNSNKPQCWKEKKNTENIIIFHPITYARKAHSKVSWIFSHY
jgi:hypothetical protein